VSVVDENPPEPASHNRAISMQVRGLTAAYGQIEVLRGLDFDVPTGSVVVILGANGSGTTTALRALTGGMGYFKPGGSMLLDGEEVIGRDSADIVRRGVAHVPQGRGTFPELSVNDNMFAGAYVRNDNEIGDDLDRYYEMFPVLGETSWRAACRAASSRCWPSPGP
jgi:branched-chain amino acid transport system ATP-binding protein